MIALAAVAAGLLACVPSEEPGPPTTPALPTATAAPQATASPTTLAISRPSTAAPSPMAATPGPLAAADVLFERNGEIWSAHLDSGQTGVVAGSAQGVGLLELADPWAWAPDRRFLALANNVDAQAAVLTLLALPDGRPQELGRFEGRVEALRWSHDSSRLAYLVSRRHARTGDLEEQSLRLYDTVSGGDRLLYRCIFQPSDTIRHGLWLDAWVPGDDALYVGFFLDQTDDPGTLYALSARGGEPRLVSPDYLLKGGGPVSAATSQVLLGRRVAESSGGGRTSPLYVARAGRDGRLSDIRQISPGDWIVGAVAWSPDGQQVAALRLEPQRHGTFAAHLWLLDLGGRAPRQLTDDEAYREERSAWMPDGLGIVFERWRATRPESAGLWSLRFSDSEPTLLDAAGARPQVTGQRSRPADW